MQTPDTQEGAYYVSAIDGPRVALLAGPFMYHADALSWVEPARIAARNVDPRADFYAYGTVRKPSNSKREGTLNIALCLTTVWADRDRLDTKPQAIAQREYIDSLRTEGGN